MMSDLTTFIVDQATALIQAQLESEQSVRTLDMALDIQAQNALAFLSTLEVSAGSPSPSSRLIDVLA